MADDYHIAWPCAVRAGARNGALVTWNMPFMPIRHIVLALSVAVVWGLSFIAIRWGVDEVAPLLLTALRYVFAALPAVFFVKRPAVGWPLLIGYGLCDRGRAVRAVVPCHQTGHAGRA
jgi:hypothetical protein